MKHTFKLASVSALLLLSHSAMAAQFIPMGFLAGGTPQSNATGVSADGSTAIGFSNTALGTEAFRWTRAGGIQSIGALPSVDHLAYAGAVSADGSVIAGYGSGSNGYEAFRWTQAGGMVALGGLGGNDGWTRADGMSADGSVIVGYSQTSAYPNGTGYRWTAASGMVDVGKLPGDFWSWARGISADGTAIVGQSNTLSGGQAYRWTAAEGMVALGTLAGATTTSAGDISNDGTVIGGSGTVGGFSRAGIWTPTGGWENLGTLNGYQQSSEAGITGDGSMVFGQVFNFDTATYKITSEGMVWDRAHGMRFAKDWLTADYGLDLANWTLTYVNGISDDGKTVVGTAIDPSGNTQAWVADLRATPAAVPLPSSVWLMGSALFGIVGARRQRQSKLGLAA